MLSTLPADGLYFDAVLRPRRSLGRRGFHVLFAIVGTFSIAAGVLFATLGAWPVSGFFGLDVLGLYIAFRASYRAVAQESETIRLSDGELVVRRICRGQAREWSFQPYWLQVETVIDDEQVVALLLRSHGRELVVGRFLSPVERQDLATRLRDALVRQRAAAIA